MIEASARLPRNGRTNRNYYPYYCYKVLSAIIPPEDVESRRILCYVHLQAQGTVEANDDEWFQICRVVGEIKYEPTDRGLAVRYARH